MTIVLRQRGQYWYGDSAADIREILAHPYHGVLACTLFADVVCECEGRVFDLLIDDKYRERGSVVQPDSPEIQR
jgi:hypothetical protein